MNPRIAIYYDTRFGRNDGPPLYWKHALQTMGYNVTRVIPEGDTRKYGAFDLHLWVDWGEDGLPGESKDWYPPHDGGKTAYIASDTHLGADYRLNRAGQSDFAFFNQPAGLALYEASYKKHSNTAMFLPHSAEPEAYPYTVQAKKYDVCFIGHLSDEPNVHGMSRVEVLDRAFRAHPNFYFGSRSPQNPALNMFEDAARKYSQSRIVLNQSVRDDGLNMRFFEVLASGGFLLTSRTPDAETIGLIEDRHFVAYESYEELEEKISYYLKHEREREQIATNGHEAFTKEHTYQHRARTLLTMIFGEVRDK